MRQRIVRSRWREALFLAWTLSDFAMLVTGTLADGGTHSPLVLVFFLPVVFSATSYPLASVVAVGVVEHPQLPARRADRGRRELRLPGVASRSRCCARPAMSAWQAQNHKRQHRALATASRTDPLTGCLNRRGFQERADAEIAAMARSGLGGAIVMLDIDKFKPVNDVLRSRRRRRAAVLGRATRCGTRCAPPTRSAVSAATSSRCCSPRSTPTTRASAPRRSPTRWPSARRPRWASPSTPTTATHLETLTRRADTRLYGDAAARATPANSRRAGPAAVYDPEAGGAQAATFGPIDLWRAALEAMPDARAAASSSDDARGARRRCSTRSTRR